MSKPLTLTQNITESQRVLKSPVRPLEQTLFALTILLPFTRDSIPKSEQKRTEAFDVIASFQQTPKWVNNFPTSNFAKIFSAVLDWLHYRRPEDMEKPPKQNFNPASLFAAPYIKRNFLLARKPRGSTVLYEPVSVHIPSNTKSNETKSQKVTVLHSSSKHTSPYGKFSTRIRIQILNPLSTIFHSVLILHFNSFSNRRSFRFLPSSIHFNPYLPSSSSLPPPHCKITTYIRFWIKSFLLAKKICHFYNLSPKE
jgi:hypothetical protein